MIYSMIITASNKILEHARITHNEEIQEADKTLQHTTSSREKKEHRLPFLYNSLLLEQT